ncbi:MAG: hypothetical protein EOP23_12360 [Hyphomicrobiales bacterium]|nr:MAG: hypothetical protein EOP23_12360 [Hyphomicrobiales bacterium]
MAAGDLLDGVVPSSRASGRKEEIAFAAKAPASSGNAGAWAHWIVYPAERQREHKIRLFRDWILAEARAAQMTLPVMASSRGLVRPSP